MKFCKALVNFVDVAQRPDTDGSDSESANERFPASHHDVTFTDDDVVGQMWCFSVETQCFSPSIGGICPRIALTLRHHAENRHPITRPISAVVAQHIPEPAARRWPLKVCLQKLSLRLGMQTKTHRMEKSKGRVPTYWNAKFFFFYASKVRRTANLCALEFISPSAEPNQGNGS